MFNILFNIFLQTMNFCKLLNQLQNYEEELYNDIAKNAKKVPQGNRHYIKLKKGTAYDKDGNQAPCHMKCGNNTKYIYAPKNNSFGWMGFCSIKCANEAVYASGNIKNCTMCSIPYSTDYNDFTHKVNICHNNNFMTPPDFSSCSDDLILEDESCVFCDKKYNEQNKKYSFFYSKLFYVAQCNGDCKHCTVGYVEDCDSYVSKYHYYYICSGCYAEMYYNRPYNDKCNICHKYFQKRTDKISTKDIFKNLILACKDCDYILKAIDNTKVVIN